jgi:hypothetical protein
MRVDPGEHAVLVRAPQHTDVRVTLHLGEGESRQLDLEPGAAIATAGAAAAKPSPAAESAPAPSRPLHRSAPPSGDHATVAAGSPLRTAGFVALGVGAVGLAAGVAGGLMTMSAKSTADSNCTGGCNGSGLDAESQGKTWSSISTIGFVAGGAALAAGVTLLVVAPSGGSRVEARPAVGGGELRWVAAF